MRLNWIPPTEELSMTELNSGCSLRRLQEVGQLCRALWGQQYQPLWGWYQLSRGRCLQSWGLSWGQCWSSLGRYRGGSCRRHSWGRPSCTDWGQRSHRGCYWLALRTPDTPPRAFCPAPSRTGCWTPPPGGRKAKLTSHDIRCRNPMGNYV